jgi:hypothetical protein
VGSGGFLDPLEQALAVIQLTHPRARAHYAHEPRPLLRLACRIEEYSASEPPISKHTFGEYSANEPPISKHTFEEFSASEPPTSK